MHLCNRMRANSEASLNADQQLGYEYHNLHLNPICAAEAAEEARQQGEVPASTDQARSSAGMPASSHKCSGAICTMVFVCLYVLDSWLLQSLRPCSATTGAAAEYSISTTRR